MITTKRVTIQQVALRSLGQAVIFAVLLPVIMLIAVPTANAQSMCAGDPTDPATCINGCMDDIFPGDLNCNANDIQVAGVADKDGMPGVPDIEILDPDGGCAFPGDTVTFIATFDVITTAKRRHDVGIYWAVDGDPNMDGALTGQCAITVMPFTPDQPWLDLDGKDDDPNGLIQDTCGDIDKPGHNPLNPTITLTTKCIDPDGDGLLNLPNCTSWRQFGANELCTSPLDAFPGSPSKCRCDIGFTLPIEVPVTQLDVLKTVTPLCDPAGDVDGPGCLVEPGGDATFTVTITNPSPFADVQLDSILDDELSDGMIVTDISSTCDDPDLLLGPGEFTTCTFIRAISGNYLDSITDTVNVSGTDSEGRTVTGSDPATVDILNDPSSISIMKTAACSDALNCTGNPTEILEPGGDVTYTYKVTNTSDVDTVFIDSLTDDQLLDLDGQGDCDVTPAVELAAGGMYSCSVTVALTGNAGDTIPNEGTASGVDDDGISVGPVMDTALITVVDVPSMITLLKTVTPLCDDMGSVDGPGCVNEPRGNVTYTYKVTNTSTVDTVTIDSLTDDVLMDLQGQGDCDVVTPPVVLAPGGMYSCSVTVPVEGNVGDMIDNTGTASGVDDDNVPVSAMDVAAVNFNNVDPAAAVTKIVTKAVVSYRVTIDNLSVDTDPLTLISLTDTPYGDLLDSNNPNISNNTCDELDTVIPASNGDSVSCSFDAVIDSPDGTATVTDTVTGQLEDDETTPVSPDPSDDATVTIE